jgi:hypothetical protein
MCLPLSKVVRAREMSRRCALKIMGDSAKNIAPIDHPTQKMPGAKPVPDWRPLCEYTKDHEQQHCLGELRAKRLRYRYLLAGEKEFKRDQHNDNLIIEDGDYHHDDLGEHFWHGAKINWIWSSATWRGCTAQLIEVFLDDRSQPRPVGRPQQIDPVINEAIRSLDSSALLTTLDAFATFLLDWWELERKKSKPPGRELAKKTIENAVRRIFNEEKAKRPQSK